MLFIDTNIFIRVLTEDDVAQADLARDFLIGVERGETVATTSEGVIVEIVQVLSSKALYNLPREQIEGLLSPLIGLRGLTLPHRRVYQRALALYAGSSLDFVDCLNVAHMERLRIDRIVSFDRHFDRVTGIARVEPS